MQSTGKHFVVTGGASGIGKTTAIMLARGGAHVTVGDIDEAGGAALVEETRAAGLAVSFYRLDLAEPTAIDAFAAQVKTRATLDGLVNAAGWDDLSQPFVENSPALWDRILEINLKGPIRLTHALLPLMIAGKSGRIVMIASEAARIGSSGNTMYSAAKGGVIAFTKALAREMARSQISVNCVSPGPVDTPFLFRAIPPNLRESMIRTIPLGRIAQPDDIAEAILFFLTGPTQYITGQVLSVSGGMTMIG